MAANLKVGVAVAVAVAQISWGIVDKMKKDWEAGEVGYAMEKGQSHLGGELEVDHVRMLKSLRNDVELVSFHDYLLSPDNPRAPSLMMGVCGKRSLPRRSTIHEGSEARMSFRPQVQKLMIDQWVLNVSMSLQRASPRVAHGLQPQEAQKEACVYHAVHDNLQTKNESRLASSEGCLALTKRG